MGTWAVGTFGNDFALDWAEDLQESKDVYFIEETLNNVLGPDSADYLEAPYGAEALAAIDVLARLQGQAPDGDDDDADEAGVPQWVREAGVKFKRRPDLTDKAQRAIAHIVSERSELRALWQDSDEYDNWRAAVQALLVRVSAP